MDLRGRICDAWSRADLWPSAECSKHDLPVLIGFFRSARSASPASGHPQHSTAPVVDHQLAYGRNLGIHRTIGCPFLLPSSAATACEPGATMSGSSVRPDVAVAAVPDAPRAGRC